MIRITIPKEFTRPDGKPYRLLKYDAEGKPVKDTDQTGVAEGQVKYSTEVASWEDLIKTFLNGIFDLVARATKDDPAIKRLSHQDSVEASDVFRALRKFTASLDTDATKGVERVFRLEKSTYNWIESLLKQYGSYSEMFGVNAYPIYEPFDPTNIVDEEKAREIEELKAA